MRFDAIDSFQRQSNRGLLIIAQLHVTVRLNRASVTVLLSSTFTFPHHRKRRKYEAQRFTLVYVYHHTIETELTLPIFLTSTFNYFLGRRIRTVIKTSINTILLINRSNHLPFNRPLSIKKNISERPKHPSTRSKHTPVVL